MSKVFVRIIKGLLIFFGLILITFLLLAFYEVGKKDFGENINSVDWLPKEATEISFNKEFFHEEYEFKISEQGFLRWAKKNKFDVEDVKSFREHNNLGTSIYRYNAFLDDEYNNTTVYIDDGYFYDYRNSSGNGGGRTIGYDRETGKAYYSWSSH